VKLKRKLNFLKKVFKNLLNTFPSSLQIGWAKRFFLGESFAIVAPTGTGKTTFGLISSLFTPKKSFNYCTPQRF
jgi:reverse gyrase